MKNNKNKQEIQLFLAVSFSVLLYPLSIGLNSALFMLALLLSVLWYKPDLTRSANGKTAIILCILSGISMYLYGNTLSALASIACITYLAGVIHSPRSTFVFAAMIMPVNVFLTPVRIAKTLVTNKVNKVKSGTNVRIIAYIIIPILALTVFTALYVNASPQFAGFIHDIHIEISIIRLLFTFTLGILLAYLVFHFSKRRKTRLMEYLLRDKLSPRVRTSIHGMDRITEHKMGIFLIILLITLISLVILSEIFIPAPELPEFILNHQLSSAVHSSVIALIISIILSVLIIQWLLRFSDEKNAQYTALLKILSLLWMILNFTLVAITAYKNMDYVGHLGLSYLRIGVFFYLLAATIGILYAVNRIFYDLNMWFLVRKNAFVVLFLFVLASIVPWDMIITRYNIYTALKHERSLDKGYIRGLRHYDRMALYEYEESTMARKSDLIYLNHKNEVRFKDDYTHEFWISTTLNEYINKQKSTQYDITK